MNVAVLFESWNQKRRGLFVFEIRFAEAQLEFEFLKVFEEKGMGGDQAQRSDEQDEGRGGSEGEGKGKEIEAERHRVASPLVDVVIHDFFGEDEGVGSTSERTQEFVGDRQKVQTWNRKDDSER